MKKLLFLGLLVLFVNPILSDMNCLNDRLWYKRYQPVSCTCPCDRYKHSYDRGRCEQCLHFRAPRNDFVGQQEEWVE